MCGINGIVNFDRPGVDNEIHTMNLNLNHRGPDGRGIKKFKNAYLGHTRLSIQDLSEKGKQPMSVDGHKWIVFNGEIYNFKEIKKELENKNYIFYSNTDTEVILNSYQEWGEECFSKFNGMWAIAILDEIQNTLLICRDRFGVKPCYIYNTKEKFIFSSEIKPILAVTNEELDSNKRLLNEILLERYFTTAYQNIDILEPGHYLKINLSTANLEKKRWWNGLENLYHISPNRNIIIEELKEKLQSAVNIRLISDVKIATSLSGGLDSSVIFSELNRIGNSIVDLNPFIVNYKSNITFEKAINLTKLHHKNPIIVEGDKNLNFEDILNTFSALEKKQFYSKQLDLYRSQKLNGFKVSIDGHGADECLAGYVDNLKDIAIHAQNFLVDTYKSISEISNDALSRVISNNYLTRVENYVKIDLGNFFTTNQAEKNFYFQYKNTMDMPKFIIDDLDDLKNFDFNFQSLYIKSNHGYLQWLLNKWDRASMHNSIEIRSPYLDWRFFQYALSIPGHHKVMNGKNKSILRDAYQADLPQEIINDKNKQGLAVNDANYTDLILNNIVSEKDFIENKDWDSKKIISDVKAKNLNAEKINEIIKVSEAYVYEKAMNLNLIKSDVVDGIDRENFNILNN